ncbi:cytosolic sulfotransferase 11-like [Brassica napus]|uniref:cytosolic sulfotransferase 11-like n=1 Tax=Brassica napus TaxID=3708 RepID=UPI0006AA7188|nr:cytosolic sulfotransferase 11-like [Brassica napus]
MEGHQGPPLPNYMKDDKVSQETKNLISTLPSDKDFMGYPLYNYKGCWYYPNTLQAVLDVQAHFRPRKTDIILASLPKGGTTWLKSLVFALVHREKYRENPPIHPLLSENPHDLVPFLEIKLSAGSQTPDLSKFPSPMIYSTHMHLNTLREATTKSSSSPCKVVYVCRGIKDTFVSGWHYRNMLHRTKMDQATFELMFDAYWKGVILYGPYWEHVLGYWNGSLEDGENVLFLKYEEMFEEPRVQVKRLAEFLDCPFTEEEEKSGSVEEILKLCSLRNLSNLEINMNGTTRIGIDSNVFFRKGEVGGDWKNHLTPQMAKKIDDIVECKLQGSGLIFQQGCVMFFLYLTAHKISANKVVLCYVWSSHFHVIPNPSFG